MKTKVSALIKKEIYVKFRSGLPFWGIALFQLASSGWLFLIDNFFEKGIADLSGFFRILATLFTFLLPLYAAGDLTDERRTGVWELLGSYPYSAAEIIAAKFLSNILWTSIHILQIVLILIPTAAFGAFDRGVLLASLLGVCFYGILTLSIGMYFSTLVRRPILAYFLSLGCILILLTLPALSEIPVIPTGATQILIFLSVPHRLDGFSRGLLSFNDLVFFLGGIFLFLTLAKHRVEVWKWE